MYQVATYAPKDIILQVSGFTVEGWDTITIEKLTKTSKIIRGIRGKNTRCVNQDTSLSITFEILQTSVANDVLTEIAVEDQKYGTGRLEVFLKDNSGRTVVSSNDAFIESVANLTYGADVQTRTWNILCLSASDYNVRGNENSPLSLLSKLFK